MRYFTLLLVSLGSLHLASSASYFAPRNRLSGIGADRENIGGDLLEVRTAFMIQSQTFSVMREAQSVAGAQRITSPKLPLLFRTASERSGIPVSTLEASAYLG